MMRIRLLVICLLLPILSDAREVSFSQARRQAEVFFKAAPSTKASGGRIYLAWSGLSLDESGPPALYAFAREGGGFVVIAGDDVSGPVLGYSLDGLFSEGDLPSNVLWWFSEIVAGMRRVRDAGISGRQNLQTKASGGVVLNTPHWDQAAPYNRMTPNNSLTGCVATAMAEIIGYYKYPVEPVGVIPSYTFKMDDEEDYTVPETILTGRHYDFDMMTGDMISQLMVDCGFAVKMKYGHGSKGSLASSYDAWKALVTYFKYNEHSAYLSGSFYSERDWLTLLRNEIDNGAPVFYSAQGSPGGHAFLVDGYNAEGQLHINFGWSGLRDGFYTFPDLGDYNASHAAIIGLRPVSGGAPLIVWGINKNKDGDKGLTANKSSFMPQDPFQVRFSGFLSNVGYGDLDGSVFLAQVDSAGSFIRPVSEEAPIKVDSFHKYYPPDDPLVFDCVLTVDYSKGDRLVLYYILDEGETPMPVAASDEVSHFATYIPIIDGTPKLGSLSSLTFDKESGVLSFRTAEYVRVGFMAETGETYPEAITILSPGNLEIDTKALPKGNYRLSLQAGTRSKTIEITL